jgi:alpha-L-fucosidase 2
MKRRRFVWAYVTGLALHLPGWHIGVFAADPTTTLWFDQPAKSFHESLPLGNGRIGAMVFGGVNEERIVLNESLVWSGSREDADRPDAHKAPAALPGPDMGSEDCDRRALHVVWPVTQALPTRP